MKDFHAPFLISHKVAEVSSIRFEGDEYESV